MTMQTRARSRGPVSPPRPASSPIARRTRKRASSNGNAPSKQASEAVSGDTATGAKPSNSRDSNAENNNIVIGASKDATAPDTTQQTPRKAKRVRFSAPEFGGAGYGDDLEPPATPGGRNLKNNNTTGLTPQIGRTKLDSNSTKKRLTRKSMPANISSIAEEDNTLPSPPPTAKINRIQFTPLRDVLDERVKRRLRRSHLSEEINDIEAEKKDAERAKREVASLREHRIESETKIQDLMYELETQRFFGIQVGTEEEHEAEAMREELERLRQEIAGTGAVDEEHQQVAADNPSDFDESLGFNSVPNSPGDLEPPPSSPTPLEESDGPLAGPAPKYTDQGTQVGTSSLTWSFEIRQETQSLKEQIAQAERETSDAQEAFNLIRDQLRTLGFASEDADPVESIVAINNAFRQARLTLERLLPGETAPGFENAAVVPELLKHAGILIERIRDTERSSRSHSMSESALRRNLNETLERVSHLENRITILLARRQDDKQQLEHKDQLIREMEEAAHARVTTIDDQDSTIQRLRFDLNFVRQQLKVKESQVKRLKSTEHDSGVTIERLQGAIETYRKEVYSLEALVTSMDAEKEASQTQMSERDGTMQELTEKATALEQKNASLEIELKEAKEVLTSTVEKHRDSLDGCVNSYNEASQVVSDFLQRNQ